MPVLASNVILSRQVNQLRKDNIVQTPIPSGHASFAKLLASFPPSYLPSSAPPSRSEKDALTSVETILPEYLGGGGVLDERSGALGRMVSGKRMHGKKGFNG